MILEEKKSDFFPYFYMLQGTLHNKSVPSFENRWEPFSIREPFRNPLSVIVWKKRKSSVYSLRRHLLPQRFIVIDFVHASHNFFQANYDLLRLCYHISKMYGERKIREINSVVLGEKMQSLNHLKNGFLWLTLEHFSRVLFYRSIDNFLQATAMYLFSLSIIRINWFIQLSASLSKQGSTECILKYNCCFP